MNEIVKVVYNDLLVMKEWFDVKVCINKLINTTYLVAQETSDSLKNVVVACHNSDQLSHAELLSLFDSLSPPGEMTSYEDGLLLAIVGNSSAIVYHRVLPGMCNVLLKAKRKELFLR